MIRYFNSGLYAEAFYTKHNIDFYSDNIVYEDIEYNSELLAEHYKNDLGFEYSDEDDRWEQVNQIFWDNLSYWPTYFEPLVFNEKIVLECGLTPFVYKGINMLALSGCGMDLSPRLPGRHPVLLRSTPIRTVLDSFPSHGSSLSKPMPNMSR